jgi:concentrative nucleoside transporter, CNT family
VDVLGGGEQRGAGPRIERPEQVVHRVVFQVVLHARRVTGRAAGGKENDALRVLPMIVFFSSLIAVLYHLGIMQKVIMVLGGSLRRLLGTSNAESMSAAANIFVGQTEAPLVVKPYISRMTSSELFAVMVGGLASVAGSVLAGYAAMGVEMKYLLAASFMAAPGGLLYAKLIMPETATPEEAELAFAEGEEKPANVLDAAALGAGTGLKLALNVGAMLLAFIGLIALVNLMLGGIGNWFGMKDLSLQWILGWLFSPLAWLAGVPLAEIRQGGSLIGQKLVLNEFVAYIEFTSIKASLSLKTQAVCSVALCGFANFSSIAILLGGLGGLAPNRRQEIARLGLKAVAAATLANLTSAAIVGRSVRLAPEGESPGACLMDCAVLSPGSDLVILPQARHVPLRDHG